MATPPPLAAAPAAPSAAADSIPDADDYDAQLDVVRSLKSAGASPARVKSAAMKLAQLKRATWVPSGTASRRKKRRAAIEAAKEGLDPREVERMEAARDAAAVAEYPARDLPPIDADGFVVSFPPPRVSFSSSSSTTTTTAREDDTAAREDDAAALAFFRRYGFVVYRDVLTREECAATRAEIWDYLERVQFPPAPGASRALSRHDVTTWDLMDNRDTYGLAPEPSVFTAQCVRNRQNPRVIACLAKVLTREDDVAAGDPSPTAAHRRAGEAAPLREEALREVIVSQDRWCVYRPTVNVRTRRDVDGDAQVDGDSAGDDDGKAAGIATGASRDRSPNGAIDDAFCLRDKPEWRTRPNVHLDLHPWNFAAPRDVLPTEDLTFDALRDFSRETNAVSSATGPHCQGVVALMDNRAEDGGTVLVPGFHAAFARWRDALGDPTRYAENHEDWDKNRLVWRGAGAGSFKFGANDGVHRLKTRVPMREGSYLIWDQRVAHGSAPNASDRPRMAQFVKGFLRFGAGAARLKRRAARIEVELARAGTSGEVSALGARVFGLDAV